MGDTHSLFEPAHGSAPDIAGKGVASPISTLLSGALMMRHLGEAEGATRLEKAVETVVRQGVLTPDLGGQATTRDVTDAILKHL